MRGYERQRPLGSMLQPVSVGGGGAGLAPVVQPFGSMWQPVSVCAAAQPLGSMLQSARQPS